MAPIFLENSILTEEEQALERFKSQNPELFQKNDAELFRHLGLVILFLALATALTLLHPWIPIKILFGTLSAFCWFSLFNVTLHHHITHRNAAAGPAAKKMLDILYGIAVPNAPKRKNRYTRAHLNHHFRPFHETDVDHHYGTERFARMIQKPWTAFLYFLELTFVGGHMPGWVDDRYMNQVPVEEWNRRDYRDVKLAEVRQAQFTAVWQWGVFFLMAVGAGFPRPGPGAGTAPLHFIVWISQTFAWGWIFPMLLVKNWAHFLGQFQHYDRQFLEDRLSVNRRTKTFRIPAWLNDFTGGELSGHFLHHLFPEMPYYHVERARQRMTRDPELARLFVIL